MPLEGEHLTIEPSHPLAGVFRPKVEGGEGRLRNQFWSNRLHGYVGIAEFDGKICVVPLGLWNSLAHELRTMGCSEAWGIEQESAALKLLAEQIPHHAFRKYLLAGSFLETSKRSGVTYMFRKLRPTVAMRPHHKRDDMTVLCCLCMHPIGYYDDSWAGAMCPTDDVLAHLMLMRGDEPMFWRRCNQIPASRPNAGLGR